MAVIGYKEAYSQNGKNKFAFTIETETSGRSVTCYLRVRGKGNYVPYYGWTHTVQLIVAGSTVVNKTGKYPGASGDWSSNSVTINGTSYTKLYTAASYTYTFGDAGGSISVSGSYSITGTATYLPVKGTYTPSGTVSMAAITLWNDINAYQPDGSTQSGLMFDLKTSDGDSWTNIVNEPTSFTKPYGTTATISNIRTNVTGAHYTTNSITGTGASSFSWTFTTASYTVKMYSAWNTYTVVYNGNGATSGSTSSSTHTYGTAKNLTTNGYSRTGYTFLGWSTSSTATSATYTNGQSVSNLTTTNGETVTLYAIWKAMAPYSLSLNTTNISTSSIELKLIASSAVTISNYTVYYKAASAAAYASYSFGTSATGTITGLVPDTDYTIYFTATNSTGTTQSETKTYSTNLTMPTISDPEVLNLLPYSCTISADGSVDPARTLTYEFSKDNGNTWYSSSSNIYQWTELEEGTLYQMRARVTAAHTASYSVDTTTTSSLLEVTTPIHQAEIRIKKDSDWTKGKAYFKKDGQWIKVKKIYTKVDGEWKVGLKQTWSLYVNSKYITAYIFLTEDETTPIATIESRGSATIKLLQDYVYAALDGDEYGRGMIYGSSNCDGTEVPSTSYTVKYKVILTDTSASISFIDS